jgi:hypothetical protein
LFWGVETCDTLRRAGVMSHQAQPLNREQPGQQPPVPLPPDEIQAQLKRIVESPFFRSSKRCRSFLERVVEHSLTESPEPLKERTLGVDVFKRDPAYDTAVDPVVRVTAGEVRRRLGQYYGEEAHHSQLRLDLPPGSYAPAYSRPHGVAAPPTPSMPDVPPAARRRGRLWGFAGIGTLLAVAAAAVLLPQRQPVAATSTFDRFWAPLLTAPGPVLLCPGGLDMYELPYDLKHAADAAVTSTTPPFISVSPRQVQRVGARYVAIADAIALAKIAAVFQQRGRPYQIRENNLTSFADLRASPAVLIGMFSNGWTLQLGSGFRFVPTIEGDGHHVGIIDRQQPERSWRLPRPWPALNVSHDYAFVSRVLDSATGTVVVMAAGITPYGTAAAGEFLTTPDELDHALGHIGDWSNRSLQIVLETQVIGGAAGAPRVVATHIW